MGLINVDRKTVVVGLSAFALGWCLRSLISNILVCCSVAYVPTSQIDEIVEEEEVVEHSYPLGGDLELNAALQRYLAENEIEEEDDEEEWETEDEEELEEYEDEEDEDDFDDSVSLLRS